MVKLMTKTARGGCSDGVMQRSQQIKDCEDTRDVEVLPVDSCVDVKLTQPRRSCYTAPARVMSGLLTNQIEADRADRDRKKAL